MAFQDARDSAFEHDHSAMLVPPSVALDPAFRALNAANESVAEIAVTRTAVSLERQGFRVGPLNFLTAYDRASELSEMVPIYPLPNTASWFRGLATLHGNLVPVVDLASMVGVRRDTATKLFLLVLGHGDAAVAVLIDGLPARLKLDIESKEAPPSLPEVLTPYVAGAYIHEDSTWLEFDHEAFFAATMARASI